MIGNAKYIVGIDLGDGESSIAYVQAEGESEPQMFTFKNGEQSMLTAYAELPGENGETLIGDDAILYDRGPVSRKLS